MEQKLLKAEEIAAMLDVSKSFVYQMIRKGDLPAVRFGLSVRVRPQDLDAFVEASLVSGVSQPMTGRRPPMKPS